jgi:outer membrane receptor protein involved in Fe transport
MADRAWVLALCGTGLMALGVGPAGAADSDKDQKDVAPTNPATAQELPQVIIIGTAPLPGLGLPLEQVPDNVQTASSQDIRRQQSLDLTDFLNNNFSGISSTQSQGNPFQADVNYHGFTASPLLGTPEGLSVYVDGVRVNEAFGDTVNWDLIPAAAIANVTLSGSNPVFGLNTLGGALAVQTKSGHDFPGTELQGYGGSFGRRAFEGETGGARGGFDYFLAANYFDEDGWRDLSPSTVKQLFGKAGWQDEKTDLDLSYTWADTALIGNGTTPESMLAVRRQAIYSAPDFTNNKLNFVNATGSHFLLSELLVAGNAYYRHLTTHTNNGDINDDNYFSDDYDGPDVDCDNFTSRADVAYCANGINRASTLTQRTWGLGAQLTESHDLFGLKNQAVAGATFDRSNVDYVQGFQYATLTEQRSTVPIDDPNNAFEIVNSVSGISKIFGVYVTDTVSPSSLVHVTASARYNRIQETLGGYSVDTDVGDFDNGFDEPNALYGNHTYDRVNPSLGVTLAPSKALTLYANYTEGSRAPTVIELGCSNPEQPCGLPNDFVSDPDLKQVVVRTFEVGARGLLPDDVLNWSFDAFRTNSTNDIQFVATTTSQGYFANVGSTRRQGVDLGLGGNVSTALRWHLVYSFVDATYRSSFEVNGESNSTADDDGNIQVSPGNRIPLVPRHTGRLRLDYALGDKWDVGGSLIVSSDSYLHGDENNANQPDGNEFIGSGRIGGYSVVNLDTTWHMAKMADLFVRVVNVFDKHYATAGFLTTNSFDPNGTFRDDPDDWTSENAVSPGQPIAVWAGIRVHWD